MRYEFRKLDEAIWAVGIAVAVSVFQALVTFDPETITDYKTWAVGIVAGAVRAAAGAAIAFLTKPRQA